MIFLFALVLAQPVVMIMQTTIIIQPIQRVTEVQIIETVRATASSSRGRKSSKPSASFHASGTGIFLGTGTAPMGTGSYETAVSGKPAPSNHTEPESWTKRLH